MTNKTNLISSLNNTLKEYISNEKNYTHEEKERYIKNEVSLIFDARKILFSKIGLKALDDFNLIEVLNLNRPSQIYTAVIKSRDGYYYFKKNDSDEVEFLSIDLKELKKINSMLSCMIEEMDKKSNKLITEKTSTFDFDVYITKVISTKSIDTYFPNNVCDSKSDNN
ncbi:MAG: hypothetical protein GYB32_07790 [Algicola sp.]|nr:hypothetical protein [Algicola sp.]